MKKKKIPVFYRFDETPNLCPKQYSPVYSPVIAHRKYATANNNVLRTVCFYIYLSKSCPSGVKECNLMETLFLLPEH